MNRLANVEELEKLMLDFKLAKKDNFSNNIPNKLLLGILILGVQLFLGSFFLGRVDLEEN